MDSRRRIRILLPLGLLVAVALLASASPGENPKPPEPSHGPKSGVTPGADTPKSWKIVVGMKSKDGERDDDPCSLKEDDRKGADAKVQTVRRGAKHDIQWRSARPELDLALVFYVPKPPADQRKCGWPPFAFLKKPVKTLPNGMKIYVLNAEKGVPILSGPVKDDACVNVEIVYDQVLGERPCDGRMIVRP